MARTWGAPGALGAALRAHGVLLGEHGEDSLREAVHVLDGTICKLEHAKTLIALGALLRRAGRRRDARQPLTDGLQLAHTCGARPLATRAEQELRATGATPRTHTDRDTLTASEQRVAEMAAQGLTNKQIAQALYVTVKTVETHLHRTYQKLNVSSRAQIAAALQAASANTG